MKLLGAEVKPVTAGHGTLKDAMNEALRDWVTNVDDTYYLIGTAAGPHPYPEMVRDFQAVIGDGSASAQMLEAGRPPAGCWSSRLSAVVRMPSASSILSSMTSHVRNRWRRSRRARVFRVMSIALPSPPVRPGVLHGNRTYLLQDEDGQIKEGHSISAGLDYPGIGPEHSAG